MNDQFMSGMIRAADMCRDKIPDRDNLDDGCEFDYSPMDFYEEYSEWLCTKSGLLIGNGKMLVDHIESATMFDEFMEQRKK